MLNSPSSHSPQPKPIEHSSKMPPPRPLPVLTDDAVGEILLRFPPDDPASLARASAVLKSWHRLLSESAFPGRYRAFHRVPPLLGFFHNQYCSSKDIILPRFAPTATPSPPFSPPPDGDICCWALDCRHDRVLILDFESQNLIVWDPISGDQEQVLPPDYLYTDSTAAVLCPVDHCNHLECSGGPFRIVFKGTDDDIHDNTWVCVYSSETGTWSVPVSIHLDPILNPSNVTERSLLIGDAVYFTLEDGQRVLKYDMGHNVLSLIILPPLYQGNRILVAAEDNRLGIAGVEGYSLHLLWRLDPDGGVEKWVSGSVIKLDTMLPRSSGDPSTRLDVVGFAERASIVFIRSNAGIFTVETKSGQVRKVDERGKLGDIFPYESFYIPGHADARLREPMRTE